MKKLILIGAGGAGKSTLAALAARKLELPVVHLDCVYWRSGWREPSKAEWQAMVCKLLEADSWVMDGNYGGTLDLRLSACDTVVFLDLPPVVCVWRVILRRLQFHGRNRPNMAEGCPEKLDIVFLWWILSYRWKRRPTLLKKLASVSASDKRVFILKSQKQVDNFVNGLAGPENLSR